MSKDGEEKRNESSFFLSDISSLLSPNSLFQGDGNTFLNIMIFLILGGGLYLSVKEPQDSMKIMLLALGVIYFIYVSYMINPLEKNFEKDSEEELSGVYKQDQFLRHFTKD